ncbi:prolipoprotein diacylglyceryl transferase (plasmid) [Vibrio campbellii]|uniref:prolipoprotein diacylglyceryl transferase n=1 Tax=Vibrio campbellii TaxID=680 RepID=UPI000494306F|nr:prolipoprotein diacylglyceryl transferase [Vibrio campbellii]AXB34706.1 prolipoprotein diacylglyceryl transferase [Vibrio campbellii]
MNHFVWNVDPVMVSFLGLKIHWYGVLFALAITAGFRIMKSIYVREDKPVESLDSLLTYAVFGIIVGARLFHVVFYDPDYYWTNPGQIIAIWNGGLASHGGGLGIILAVYFYTLRHRIGFVWLLDRLAIATALFGFFVRTGNFFNSEIVGKPSDLPLAVIFERVDMTPRHPIMLYESVAYLAIFTLLFLLYRKTDIGQYKGLLLGWFLVLVMSARFLLEFIKAHQASYSTGVIINTGQLLSIPFILVGIILVFKGQKIVDSNRD